MFQREFDFDDVVEQWADVYGVPPWVILATIGKESSFNPGAFNASDPGGGSRGLMQIQGQTARSMGYSGPLGNDSSRTEGLYDPSVSVQYGARLLASLALRYPQARWDERYGAYNHGSIARTPTGALVNQSNVNQWGRIADYFHPTWRAEEAARGVELPMPDSPTSTQPTPEDSPEWSGDPPDSPENPKGPREE